MKMILEAPGERVDLELMCLAINLACHKRNAQIVCESKGNRPSGESTYLIIFTAVLCWSLNLLEINIL